jgi:hypothetical protein
MIDFLRTHIRVSALALQHCARRMPAVSASQVPCSNTLAARKTRGPAGKLTADVSMSTFTVTIQRVLAVACTLPWHAGTRCFFVRFVRGDDPPHKILM